MKVVMPHAVRLAAAVVTGVLLLGCGPAQATGGGANTSVTASAPKTGMAPDFTVDLIDSETFRLSDYLGKDVIVIDFWATYCMPCMTVMHHLEGLHKRYGDKGLVILAVAMDPPESAGQIVPFVKTHGFSFRVAHDVNSLVTQLYNKKSSAPYQVLIGRDGKVLKVRDAYHPGDEQGMEADIMNALGVQN